MNIFRKPNRLVTKVFLHHSATDHPHHDNLTFIYNIHVKQNGWRDVGYHYFIDKAGMLLIGRPLEQQPAAQKGFNKGTIAICLSGKERFTQQQQDTLTRLCRKISQEIAGVTFHGHKEVANTLCPAYPYKEWLGLNDQGRMTPQITKPKPTTIWGRIKHWWNNLGED